MAYSMKTTGSLYVNATLAAAELDGAIGRCAPARRHPASVSISRDFEMSQFWQNRHARLQPAVPNERTDVPGRKWFSGFFSIGSTQKPLRPAVRREHDLVALARPHEAEPALPLVEPAVPRADVALHAAVFDGVPVPRRVADAREGFHRVPRSP